jgi:Putative porin
MLAAGGIHVKLKTGVCAVLTLTSLVQAPQAALAREEKTVSMEAVLEELATLRSLVEAQQRQIERLQAALPPAVASPPTPPTNSVGYAQSQTQPQEELVKRVETLSTNLGGFKLSGDFRLRADVQARSGNAIAGPLQNIRGRYRLRFNVDRDIDPRFRFHLQLSTGPYNNEITNDQDLAGLAVKHAFSVAEAYVDYHPNNRISLRGGRMEEVFADNMRFLWDDDVRFNGFQQNATISVGSKALKTIEFRAGEYFLSNPNTPILAAGSSFVAAGYRPGQNVRDANLFHPGFVLTGDIGNRWTHQAVADIQLYRNQNQILLATTTAGVPVVVNNSIGLTLSGPIPTVGNATTTPGGAIYTAARYQVARVAYRISNRGIKFVNRDMPFYFDFQTLRNVGTHQLRDALMASFNIGNVRQFGDVRFLYQYAIKDANSIIAQFTDDDLGTGSTTNIAVHALRFDLGLTRALQWQNLFFIQNARRANDPSQQFFVPVQRGANTTFRYLGQLAFTF